MATVYESSIAKGYSSIAGYDAEVLTNIMDAILLNNSGIFSTKTLSHRCDYNPLKICKHLPNLLNVGAIEEVCWYEEPRYNKRKKIFYRRLFDRDEKDKLLKMMMRISEDKKR